MLILGTDCISDSGFLLVRSPFPVIKSQLASSVSSGQKTVGTRDSTEEGGVSGGRLT